MTLLGPADIARSLPMREAVEAMREAFAAHAGKRVQAPARAVLEGPDGRGATLVMAAAMHAAEAAHLAVKVVSVVPGNPRRGLPSIHGTVLLIDAATGVPQALLDGASLTAIRTAAACGLATDLLARPDSRVLAVFGSGVHARTQVRAMRAVRPIEEVRIFNPNADSARAMADELAAASPPSGGVRAVATASEALAGADIACTATTSRRAVFEDRDVPDGMHVNAIGSFKPADREVPGETLARAVVVVDDRAAAMEEAGDVLRAIDEGLFSEDRIRCELGALVTGGTEGRTAPGQVTVFKSVGMAIQDLAAARAVVRKARALGLGRTAGW